MLNLSFYNVAKVNKYEQDIQDYNVVVNAEPLNAHAYHNRGISYDKIGKYDLALIDFQKVS